MKIKSLIVASLAALSFAAPAFAGDVSYNAALTSDYVFRGVSQSDEGVALQGGVDATAGIWYFGGWASTIDGDLYGSDDIEYDLYAGIKPTFGKVTFDLGVYSYNYKNMATIADGGTTEYKFGASVAAPAGISLGAAYYLNTGDAAGYGYTEVTAGAPLGKLAIGPFALSAAASWGTYDYEAGGGYDNYKVAISGATEKGWGAELAYTDTDSDGEAIYGDLAKGRAVFTIKKSF